jgi:hypothetical protein
MKWLYLLVARPVARQQAARDDADLVRRRGLIREEVRRRQGTAADGKVIFHAGLFVLYGKSLMRYTGVRESDFTAHGYQGRGVARGGVLASERHVARGHRDVQLAGQQRDEHQCLLQARDPSAVGDGWQVLLAGRLSVPEQPRGAALAPLLAQTRVVRCARASQQ